MTNKVLGRPVGAKDKVLRGPRPGSRKDTLNSLEVGESVIFYGEPGATLQSLQASIGSTWRGKENMSQQGLTQQGGMLIFEGEMPTPVSRVTRLADPRPV